MTEPQVLSLSRRWTVAIGVVCGAGGMIFSLLILKLADWPGVPFGLVLGLVSDGMITFYRIRQAERMNEIIRCAYISGLENPK